MAVLVAAVLVGAPGATGHAQEPPPTTRPVPPPAAFVVVDAESGAVLAGDNDRVKRPPASTTKMLTALVARDQLEGDDAVTVSAAAAGMPARRLSMTAGQQWRARDLLQAMLLCSCNDVARALAEAAGGTVGGWGRLARHKAVELGLQDAPVIQDPTGLDADFAVGRGNRVSARDLAIMGRALLADRVLAGIVAQPAHRWRGPDGVLHEVVNRNRLFGSYPGAIGVKTGFTRAARGTLVAAATRGGRTIIAVILGSEDIWSHAPLFLDIGFATAVTATMDRLPRSPAVARSSTTTTTTTEVGPAAGPAQPDGAEIAVGTVPAAATAAEPSDASLPGNDAVVWLAAVSAGLVVVVVGRRRQVVRRRDAARARAVHDP